MTVVGTAGASPASAVSSPPQSVNRPSTSIGIGSSSSSSSRKKSGPKAKAKAKASRKSSLRVLFEILLVLVVVESYFYWKLSAKEYDEMEKLRAMEGQIMNKLASPQRYKTERASVRNKIAAEERKKQREEKQRLQAKKIKEERQKLKKELQNLTVIDDLSNEYEKFLGPERQKTADKLRHMGISGEVYLTELPPWSQILDNFNSVTRDDEPVILGLEHCAAFREKTKPEHIGFGPAGLFSTGTNLINTLGRSNCMGPLGREGMTAKFGLVQVPVRTSFFFFSFSFSKPKRFRGRGGTDRLARTHACLSFA
jgi:hypothetical protein